MHRRQDKPRRIVDPHGHRVPMFIRFCEAFVDNLAQILRLGLIVGALFLVQELHVLRDAVAPTNPRLFDAPADAIDTAEADGDAAEPWLSDGVKHALNCTHAKYRDAHYEECVDGESEIYERPGADPDDTGYLLQESLVIYASLPPD